LAARVGGKELFADNLQSTALTEESRLQHVFH